MSQLRFWLQFAALNKVTGQGSAGLPRATCGAPELSQVAELWRGTPPALPTLYFSWQVTVNMPEFFKPETRPSIVASMRTAVGGSLRCRWPELAQLLSVLREGRVGVTSVQVGLLSTPLHGQRREPVSARSDGIGRGRSPSFLWVFSPEGVEGVCFPVGLFWVCLPGLARCLLYDLGRSRVSPCRLLVLAGLSQILTQ